MKEKEIWRDIKGWEGYYQVSSNGRMKSLFRIVFYENSRNGIKFQSNKTVQEKIRKLSINRHKGKDGYYFASMRKGASTKLVIGEIHKLVATAFCGKPKGCNCVNHKDGNSLNNYYKNLEWVTHRENDCHYNLSRSDKSSKYIGVHWCSKPRKWKAVVTFNGKHIFIGQFNDEESAYNAYKNKIKHLGIKNRYVK